MRLVVGLGNPGREYDDTRHNVGFVVVDALGERAGTSVDDKKFKARVGRGRLGSDSVLLMKPQTYMNLSGESVGPALGFYKLTTEDVIVIHDDLDLPPGKLKLKRGGGHGGHNGLRSLIKHLPDDRFVRVRIGIGRPPPQWDPADYVLSKFRSDERAAMEESLGTAADAVERIFVDGVAKAMAHFNHDPEKAEAKKKKRAARAEQKNTIERPTETSGDELSEQREES